MTGCWTQIDRGRQPDMVHKAVGPLAHTLCGNLAYGASLTIDRGSVGNGSSARRREDPAAEIIFKRPTRRCARFYTRSPSGAEEGRAGRSKRRIDVKRLHRHRAGVVAPV